ncbi:hypothetical protein D3C81_1389990 [compost metagenome]
MFHPQSTQLVGAKCPPEAHQNQRLITIGPQACDRVITGNQLLQACDTAFQLYQRQRLGLFDQSWVLRPDVAQHLAYLCAFGGIVKTVTVMPLRERGQVQAQSAAGQDFSMFNQIPHHRVAGRWQASAPTLLEIPQHALIAPLGAVALHGP